MQENTEKLREKLRRVLDEKNTSQNRFAKDHDIPPSALSRFLNPQKLEEKIDDFIKNRVTSGGAKRERIKNYQQGAGLTHEEMASEIGINTSDLTHWLNPEPIIKKIRDYLELQEEKQLELAGEERFSTTAETTVFKAVTQALRHCHIKGKIGVVTSASGTGKTRACKDYAANKSGVILIECHHNFPTRSVLKTIGKTIGLEMKGNIHDMLLAITDKLRGTGRLLILDEAEHLKPSVLDEVRRIYDWAGIGIVYVGLPRFGQLMQSLRGDYTYIWNRVRVKTSVERQAEDIKRDIEVLLKSQTGNGREFVDTFFNYCKGDIRQMEDLFFASLGAAYAHKEDLSVRAINGIAKELGLNYERSRVA